MRLFAGVALVAGAMLIAGCQSTGGGVDTRLAGFCKSNGFGSPGDRLYEECLVQHSLGGRGETFDPRTAGQNGT